jgi:membrane protein
MPAAKRNELYLLTASFLPSLRLLGKNDPLRMAGATAFFTTFALPPIVFILVQLFGLFIGQRNMGQALMDNITGILGKEGAGQVRVVIRSIRGFNDSWYVILSGCLFLFFIATTLFNVMKNSLNQLWNIGVKERPGLLFLLSIRLRSFAVILLVGLLFCADLMLESFRVVAESYLDSAWPAGAAFFKGFLGGITSVVIVAVWFMMLFRFLADGRPGWKACTVGGLLTAILFSVGRLLLHVLLVESNIGHLYGTSGSFVLILLFVFYSSFILYFGGCFIAVYSGIKGWSIKPNTMAFNVENNPG